MQPSYQQDPLPRYSQDLFSRKKVPLYKRLGAQNLEGLSVRQRILAKIRVTQSNDEATTQDNALDLSTKHLQEEEVRMAEWQERMARAREALGVAPPEEMAPRANQAELISAALGGLISGDFNASNRAAMGLAQQRTLLENQKAMREYQTKQQMAEFDARLAERGINDASDRIGRLKDSQINILQDNKKTEQENIRFDRREAAQETKEKTNDLNALRRGFKGLEDPTQVRVAADEINRLAGELGVPGISEEEIKSMEDFAAKKYADKRANEGFSKIGTLFSSYGQVIMGYGGNVPAEIYTQYQNTLRSIEKQYGISVGGDIANPQGPTLAREGQEADDAREDKKLTLEQAKFAWAKKQDAIKNDQAWQTLRLKQANGEDTPKSDYDKAINSLKGKQRGALAKLEGAKQTLREYLARNGDNVDPDTEAKYRDAIAQAKQTLFELESEVQLLNEERKVNGQDADEPTGTVTPARVGGPGNQGDMVGPIGPNPSQQRPSNPKRRTEPAAKKQPPKKQSRSYTITAPTGESYTMPWTLDRPPTQAEMQAFVAKKKGAKKQAPQVKAKAKTKTTNKDWAEKTFFPKFGPEKPNITDSGIKYER